MQLGGDHAEREGPGLAQRHRGRRLGEQRVVDAAHHQQLHRIHRAGDVAQLQVLPHVHALLLGEQLQHDVGHVATEGHRQLLAAQVGERLQRRVARHQPQHAPGRYVDQLQPGTAVVQVGGDVGGHRQHVGAAVERHHAQLVGVAPGHELDHLGDVRERARIDHVDERVRHRGRGTGEGELGKLLRLRVHDAGHEQEGAHHADVHDRARPCRQGEAAARSDRSPRPHVGTALACEAAGRAIDEHDAAWRVRMMVRGRVAGAAVVHVRSSRSGSVRCRGRARRARCPRRPRSGARGSACRPGC